MPDAESKSEAAARQLAGLAGDGDYEPGADGDGDGDGGACRAVGTIPLQILIVTASSIPLQIVTAFGVPLQIVTAFGVPPASRAATCVSYISRHLHLCGRLFHALKATGAEFEISILPFTWAMDVLRYN